MDFTEWTSVCDALNTIPGGCLAGNNVKSGSTASEYALPPTNNPVADLTLHRLHSQALRRVTVTNTATPSADARRHPNDLSDLLPEYAEHVRCAAAA